MCPTLFCSKDTPQLFVGLAGRRHVFIYLFIFVRSLPGSGGENGWESLPSAWNPALNVRVAPRKHVSRFGRQTFIAGRGNLNAAQLPSALLQSRVSCTFYEPCATQTGSATSVEGFCGVSKPRIQFPGTRSSAPPGVLKGRLLSARTHTHTHRQNQDWSKNF